MSEDSRYLEKLSKEAMHVKKEATAGLGYGILANLRWFIREQRKILDFDEGVFIFMLSFALVFDKLTPMLWVFTISQLYHGLSRSWKRGYLLGQNKKSSIKK